MIILHLLQNHDVIQIKKSISILNVIDNLYHVI